MKELSNETSPRSEWCRKSGDLCTIMLRYIPIALVVAVIAGCFNDSWEIGEHSVVSLDDAIDVRQFLSWTEQDFERAFGQPHLCTESRAIKKCFYQPLRRELHVPPDCTFGYYDVIHRVDAKFRSGTLDYVIIRPNIKRLDEDVRLSYGLPQRTPDRVVIVGNLTQSLSQSLGGQIWDDYAGYHYLAVYMSHEGISHESASIERIEVNKSGEPNWSSVGRAGPDCSLLHELPDSFGGGVCVQSNRSAPPLRSERQF